MAQTKIITLVFQSNLWKTTKKKGYQEIRYFEFKDAHSSKFWEISVAGSTVTVRYGKIGTNGQTSVKELDSPEEAQEHATKQAAGKLKKGYQELQKKR